ncbi:MAG: terminase large subunit [Acetobacteraceae bacterium]
MIAGAIVAGPHVRNACRRHMQDLAVGHLRGLRYDVAAAEHVWTFFERAFRLSEGQFEGKPFALHPSQAFILGMIFGWKRADGMRRFRRAYIEQGKGNGKSPLAGGIGIYGMMADGEAGAQIYAAGARKEQAGILFQDACKMIRKSPLLSRRLRFSGGLGREFNVAHHRSGSFFRPISREAGKTGSGPRPHFALCDEVHEHPNRSVIEILERGFKFRRQPLLLMITNSGSDRKSLCREEHEHAVKVAAGTRTPDDAATYVGEVIDDDTFAYVCALDPGDDPLEDPSCWPKANPLLGVTVQHDYLAGVVRQAKDLPGALNGILRLHFCVWTDADRAWMSRATLEAVLADFDPAEHAGREVRLGIDLSATQDLTAMGAVVRTGTVSVAREDGATVELPTYDAWVEAWTPGDTLVERAVRDNAPYGVWAKDGWLNAPPGKTIRMDFMAARVAELQAIYRVTMLAYDAYAFRKHFEPQLDEAGVTIPLVEHPQGGKRRATPSEAQIAAAEAEGSKAEGLWMPGSVRELETLILERRIRIRRSPVVVSAMMSAVTESDPFDNRWFSKAKAVNRIDPLVALTIGVGATLADVGQEVRSPWEDPGFRLGSKG